MDSDFLKVLENGIIKVFDNSGNEINFIKKEVKLFKAKYSSTNCESVTLFLDNKPITNLRKLKYRVLYKCSCGNLSTIHLSKYLVKTKLTCSKCRENDEKISWHKLYFEMKRNGLSRGYKTKNKTIYNFDNESEEFKAFFFEKNITEDEFFKIKKYIYSIDSIVIGEKDIKFLQHEPSINSKKYTVKVEFDGVKHSLRDVCFKCPLCGDIFHVTRPLKERVLAHNFDCRKCFLNNKTFAIKKYEDGLTYQGKEELNFIIKCKDKDIKITDGDKISYQFDGGTHIYTIDFKLPDLKFLVEIKDNHIWHKKQVASGKWEAKENAAKKYAEENDYKFILLFPNDIDTFFNSIEIDSLNSIETVEKLG